MQKLHTADSLVRLLRIYAAGNQEEITGIMGKLSACRYVIREGKGYRIREIDKSVLQNLPQQKMLISWQQRDEGLYACQ